MASTTASAAAMPDRTAASMQGKSISVRTQSPASQRFAMGVLVWGLKRWIPGSV
jgi:hypothetical protein